MAGLADDVFVEATRAFTVWLVPPLTQLRKHVGIAARRHAGDQHRLSVDRLPSLDAGFEHPKRFVQDLLAHYKDGLMYVGFDGEYCWALYEEGKDEQDDDVERPHPCERANLKDEYVKNGVSGA